MRPWDDDATVQWSRLIVDSYHRRTTECLITATGDDRVDAEALFTASRVVLCHDGASDPRFVYANAAACTLWGIPHDELVGMPSRLSAGPDARAERASMLQQADAAGVLRGYRGLRRARDGRLFEIRDAVVWTVDVEGRPVGQAATFVDWQPVDDPAG